MENYKKNIAAIFQAGNQNLNEEQYRVFNEISDAVDYAWNNWDESIISTYHEGIEKPEYPTPEFIEQWIENEDFEAAGYDVDRLKNLFG